MAGYFDNRTVDVSLGEVAPFLTCTLCGGFLRDAHTITECLHTFCLGCVRRHMRVIDNKVNHGRCPTCQGGVSKTAFDLAVLPDHAKQRLLDKLMPQWKEADERARLEEAPTDEEGEEEVEASPAKRSAPATPRCTPSPKRARSSPSPSPARKRRLQRFVTLPVLVSPAAGSRLAALKRPLLVLPANATVGVLQKYVAGLAGDVAVELLCGGAVLGSGHTLAFVRQVHASADADEPLPLAFRPAARAQG